MSKYTEPNLQKAAVITIDVQNDCSLPGAIAEIKGTYEAIPNMVEILENCRLKNMPIIHVVRIYEEDGSNVDLCRRELIESGASILRPETEGVNLVKEIMPNDGAELNFKSLLAGDLQEIGNHEWVIYKPRWGAFYKTKLEKFLHDMDVDTLIIIGCNFPNCPRTTIYEASERDFKVIMVADAVSGVYEKGLDELKNIGVYMSFTQTFIKEISSLRINVKN